MPICNLIRPERVFYYFEKISEIPRGSGNEENIAAYIESFAKGLSLETIRDKSNNVFIKKPASKGFENAPCVLLQGHTDMVCEKNAGTEHNFETDPLKLVLNGDFLSACGTTLGADDGIAVAMMMAVLEDKELLCGPIECLFTTGEETGLLGMKAFDKSLISSEYVINLDSENSRCAVISCAGGVRSDFCFSNMPLERCRNRITLSVGGLAGGHSGDDINRGRANAVKLAFKMIANAENARIISANGGSKDNAIPRECVIEFTSNDPEEAIDIINETAHEISQKNSAADKGFTWKVKTETGEFHCFGEKNSRKIISFVNSLPYGVIAMSEKVENFVETSSNVGIIKSDKNSVVITSSSRSSVEQSLTELTKTLDSLAEFANVSSTVHRDRYPGWSPTKNSKLQKLYMKVFKDVTGNEARLEGIHAGLECGLLKGAIPNLDIISIGPDAVNIHTPDEKLSVSSVNTIYEILKKLLKELSNA